MWNTLLTCGAFSLIFVFQGISMSLVESKDGLQHFTFEHNRDYQQVQFKFFDAVESMDPNNIVVIVRLFCCIDAYWRLTTFYVTFSVFVGSGPLATQPISYWFTAAALRCMSHAGWSGDCQRPHRWDNTECSTQVNIIISAQQGSPWFECRLVLIWCY